MARADEELMGRAQADTVARLAQAKEHAAILAAATAREDAKRARGEAEVAARAKAVAETEARAVAVAAAAETAAATQLVVHALPCVVCLDRTRSHALVPCGHVCVCARCCEDLVADLDETRRCCPMCRTTIESTLRVYTG